MENKFVTPEVPKLNLDLETLKIIVVRLDMYLQKAKEAGNQEMESKIEKVLNEYEKIKSEVEKGSAWVNDTNRKLADLRKQYDEISDYFKEENETH